MGLGEPVRKFSGEIIGWYEELPNGDVIVRDFLGTILGKYDKAFDVTRDFYGRIVARGDARGMLFSLS